MKYDLFLVVVIFVCAYFKFKYIGIESGIGFDDFDAEELNDFKDKDRE